MLKLALKNFFWRKEQKIMIFTVSTHMQIGKNEYVPVAFLTITNHPPISEGICILRVWLHWLINSIYFKNPNQTHQCVNGLRGKGTLFFFKLTDCETTFLKVQYSNFASQSVLLENFKDFLHHSTIVLFCIQGREAIE